MNKHVYFSSRADDESEYEFQIQSAIQRNRDTLKQNLSELGTKFDRVYTPAKHLLNLKNSIQEHRGAVVLGFFGLGIVLGLNPLLVRKALWFAARNAPRLAATAFLTLKEQEWAKSPGQSRETGHA